MYVHFNSLSQRLPSDTLFSGPLFNLMRLDEIVWSLGFRKDQSTLTRNSKAGPPKTQTMCEETRWMERVNEKEEEIWGYGRYMT